VKFIRNIIGQVLVYLGALCFISPLYALLHADFDLRTEAIVVVMGVVLACGGVFVLRSANLRRRPRYWRAAISGIICSVCTLLLLVCSFLVYRWPDETAPDWLVLVVLLLLVGAGFAALVCIVSGVRAFFSPDVEQNQNEKIVA